jgi:heme oxygenase
MPDVIPFSVALRERSSEAHSSSEGADFMSDLMKGEGTRDDYIALVAQHWYIYDALERAAERMRRDPVASVFITDKLTRLPALEADLEFLVGPDWRDEIEPLPTTRRYVERIEKVMARRFGFETNGIGFYIFHDIADPKAFKDVYREQLDAAPWDAAEKERVIEEVLLAYRFNTELFEDLAAAKTARSAVAVA